jgi:hypothetical protein
MRALWPTLWRVVERRSHAPSSARSSGGTENTLCGLTMTTLYSNYHAELTGQYTSRHRAFRSRRQETEKIRGSLGVLSLCRSTCSPFPMRLSKRSSSAPPPYRSKNWAFNSKSRKISPVRCFLNISLFTLFAKLLNAGGAAFA